MSDQTPPLSPSSPPPAPAPDELPQAQRAPIRGAGETHIILHQAPREWRQLVKASWILVIVACGLSLIPFVGFASWLIAGPVFTATFVMSIIVLSRGGTLQGVLLLIVSMFVGPAFVACAPFVASLLGVASIGAATELAGKKNLSQKSHGRTGSGFPKGTDEIISANGQSRLIVPVDWRELDGLNNAAELQAGNRAKEQYLIVLSENKADLSNLTLQKHHQLTRDAMLKKMGNSSASQTVDLTVGGRPAVQDEISGTQEGTNIVFLHTTIESDDGYHQVLAWTTKARWDRHKEQLQEVTRSFRSDH